MSYAVLVLREAGLKLKMDPNIENKEQHLRDISGAIAVLEGKSEFISTGLPLVSVDYDEWNPETYRGIVVDIGEQKMRINSGDFEKDKQEVCRMFPAFMENASVYHYVADCKKYKQTKKGM